MKKTAKAISRNNLEAGTVLFTDKHIDPQGPRIGAIHPGTILREEFMQPLSLSAYRIAMDLHVPPIRRISEIAQGAARHFARYGAAPRAIFRYQRRFLDQSAGSVRS